MQRLEIFVSVTILLVGNIFVTANQRNFESTLETVRDLIMQGIPESNIPPLDPLYLKSQTIKLNENKIKADLLLEDVDSTGLGDFTVSNTHLEASKLQMQTEILMNKIDLDLKYDGTMTVFEFIPLYGKGNLHLEFDKYRIGLDVTFRRNGEFLTVKNSKLTFVLEAAKFKITGFLNDDDLSEIVTKFVGDMLIPFVEDHAEWMSNTYSPFLEMGLNALNITEDGLFGETAYDFELY